MKKSTLALAGVALVMAITTLTASAQILPQGAARLLVQPQNSSPLVQQAACGGGGAVVGANRCPPGLFYGCRRGPNGNVCKCVPCR
jgi:hypothetical protein